MFASCLASLCGDLHNITNGNHTAKLQSQITVWMGAVFGLPIQVQYNVFQLNEMTLSVNGGNIVLMRKEGINVENLDQSKLLLNIIMFS